MIVWYPVQIIRSVHAEYFAILINGDNYAKINLNQKKERIKKKDAINISYLFHTPFQKFRRLDRFLLIANRFESDYTAPLYQSAPSLRPAQRPVNITISQLVVVTM